MNFVDMDVDLETHGLTHISLAQSMQPLILQHDTCLSMNATQ